jgi:hypothetical protein
MPSYQETGTAVLQEVYMDRRRILQKSALIILLLLIVFPFAACHPEPVAPLDARIYIIDPAAESTITTNAVTIKTFVGKFNLVDKTGQPNSPGEGHIVYYMDITPPLEQGKNALTTDGTCAISTETSHTWSNVSPGLHNFWVQLVNNDNTPIEPPAAVRVYVTTK